jgi:hypothetical protein
MGNSSIGLEYTVRFFLPRAFPSAMVTTTVPVVNYFDARKNGTSLSTKAKLYSFTIILLVLTMSTSSVPSKHNNQK